MLRLGFAFWSAAAGAEAKPMAAIRLTASTALKRRGRRMFEPFY
jgi:hypothetical protein